MTKVNMTGWTQQEIDNWQDPMTIGMQQGPKIGIAGLKPGGGPQNPNPVYQNFMDSEFNTNQPGLAVMSDIYYGDGQKNTFGDSHSANQFREYLKSMGTPIHSGPQDGIVYDTMDHKLPGDFLKPMPMPHIVEGGLGSITNPTNYDDKFLGYDKQIGGFDNQFKDIVGRLDKLEKGLGSFAGPISNGASPVTSQTGLPNVYTGNNARGY